MNTREVAAAAIKETASYVFRSWMGRFCLAISAVAQFCGWLAEDEPAWALALRLVLVPVYAFAAVALLQFMAGMLYALVHARRPTHSWILLELKDGRRRSGGVCMPPCCLRKKVVYVLTHNGSVEIDLGDGSDTEVFSADEIEDWSVLPVDNPDPHGRA